MDRFWSLLFLAIPVLGLATVLGAAYGVGFQNAWLPESIGPRTEGIDYLFDLIHIVLGVVFVGTGLLLAFCLFRFSAQRRVQSSYRQQNIWLEALWTIVPAAILIFLALHQLPYWQANKEVHPAFLAAGGDASFSEKPSVRVVAFQYGWRFIYPGRDGILDTRDDFVSENLLVLPFGKEIVLELTSEDVIHSFAINPLRLKQDIVPGLSPRVWFEVTQQGEWEINCMELCGWGHFRMVGTIKTLSQREYDEWVTQQSRNRGY